MFGKRRRVQAIEQTAANIATMFNTLFTFKGISKKRKVLNPEKVLNDDYVVGYMSGVIQAYAAGLLGLKKPADRVNLQLRVMTFFFEEPQIAAAWERMTHQYQITDSVASQALEAGMRDARVAIKAMTMDVMSGHMGSKEDDFPDMLPSLANYLDRHGHGSAPQHEEKKRKAASKKRPKTIVKKRYTGKEPDIRENAVVDRFEPNQAQMGAVTMVDNETIAASVARNVAEVNPQISEEGQSGIVRFLLEYAQTKRWQVHKRTTIMMGYENQYGFTPREMTSWYNDYVEARKKG